MFIDIILLTGEIININNVYNFVLDNCEIVLNYNNITYYCSNF